MAVKSVHKFKSPSDPEFQYLGVPSYMIFGIYQNFDLKNEFSLHNQYGHILALTKTHSMGVIKFTILVEPFLVTYSSLSRVLVEERKYIDFTLST